MTVAVAPGQEYGLFLQETDRLPATITNLLRLLLNYRYGLDILTESSIQDALPVSSRYGAQLRTIFVVRDTPVENRNQLLALGHRGQVPLFLLVPRVLVNHHKRLCQSLKNIFICGWEDVGGTAGPSLQQIVTAVFDQQQVGHIQLTETKESKEKLEPRIGQRLKHVRSLPTLPELVWKITRMLKDPDTQIADLEALLLHDPAIVHRLLRVIASPAFAGIRATGDWTLRQAIVRLGMKQVGAIAQQILLMNTLVKPEKSPFDIRRFWEHSVGVAVIADRLSSRKLLPLKGNVPIDHYWIGGLLHDVGKLVMGMFFWDAFAAVIKRMNTPKTPFHWAEARLGNPVTHEHIASLVLTKAQADSAVVEAVGRHNSVGRKPGPLLCLLHVADNLCKGVGLGYLTKEEPVYSPPVLDALKMDEAEIMELQTSVGESLAGEISEVVSHCLGS